MTRGLSFTLICGLSTFANAVTPNSATWSSQAYGPDGPWNAVLAKLGSNEQFVALYPGDRWASTILLDTVCSTPNLTSSCLAENAGTFDISQSSSLYIPSDNSNNTSDMTWVSSANDASVNKFGSVATVKAGQLGDTVYFAGMSVPNVSINGIYEAYQTYPNGNKYPVEVGTLALGGLAMNQTVDNVTYNMVESYAWRTGSIPSYSWGMHIGAAGDSYIPGSLVMGGYDQDRIVGNVSSQPVNTTNDLGTLDIPLFDIGLGVAAGGSPWSFKSKNGLFKRSNGTSESSASVEIDPTRPYLYLPQDTCDAIAEQLPVTYNEGLGLYFWNTTVDKFEKITGSPAYLSFTFENNAGEDSSNPNTTIKVPFKLLKLTLESPLVDQNTTYFPCYPSDDYVLGRAFLQAAFLGTNWQHGNGTGYWFFAQAPGPNIQSGSVQTIGVTDTTVTGSSEAWENTWSGYWNVMPPHGGGGLSQGAKIGIGIGCGVAGAAAICVIGLLVARCMRKGKNVDPSEEEATELTTSNNQTEVAGPPPDTADTQNTAENSENASHSVNAFEQISVASAPEQTDSHEVYGGDKPPPWSPPLHPLPGQAQPLPGHDHPVPGYDQPVQSRGQVTPGYDHPRPGYDHPTPGYDHPTSEYDHTTTTGYDSSTTTTGFDHTTTGYDHLTTGYDHSATGFDHSTTGFDQSTPGYDQPLVGHDHSTLEHDPTIPSYDNPMPGYDQPLVGHDHSTPEHDPTIPSYDNPMPGIDLGSDEDHYGDYMAHIP